MLNTLDITKFVTHAYNVIIDVMDFKKQNHKKFCIKYGWDFNGILKWENLCTLA